MNIGKLNVLVQKLWPRVLAGDPVAIGILTAAGVAVTVKVIKDNI